MLIGMNIFSEVEVSRNQVSDDIFHILDIEEMDICQNWKKLGIPKVVQVDGGWNWKRGIDALLTKIL